MATAEIIENRNNFQPAFRSNNETPDSRFFDHDTTADYVGSNSENEDASPKPKAQRTYIVSSVELWVEGQKYKSRKPLRVKADNYEESFLLHLIEEPSFIVHGETLDDAFSSLFDMLAADFSFYIKKPDDQLTPDAIQLRKKLKGMFAKVDAP